MLTTWTPSCAVALAATLIGCMLSGCVGEVGDASIDGEGGGPSSGAGVVIHNGDSGSGPSTSSGGSATAGTGGSATAGAGGAGSSSAQGAGGSATAGAGGAGSSSAQGTGGSTTAGAGGSSAEGAGGSSAQGAGGSATAGTGGSSGEGSGSGAGGSGGATGAAQLCVDTINEHRATLGLPPLARWVEAESCSDGEAESDGNTGEFHGAFGACDENAQNECPGWGGPPDSMIVPCLQLMWDEGPGEDFEKHGHYINMSSTRYTKVACGFHTFPDGSVWAVQNFR
ncbi:CAP domain-containing protein [Sorangium sp. So ce124]|uniref:CAP domain-containing protein n=1 Tax=Sorangium sp. So ce124 TaxID=3133280 RepID=UPI003F612B33